MDYELKQQIQREIAEHEVFIAFCNDDDAAMFSEWLEFKGMKAFLKWRASEFKRIDGEEIPY